MLTTVVRWGLIPVLLIASVFSGLAGRYEPLMNGLVCMTAIVLVQRAVRLRQYVWGVGFTAIAVVFGPFHLVVKIFLMLGLACLASLSAMLAGFRRRRVPAVVLASL